MSLDPRGEQRPPGEHPRGLVRLADAEHHGQLPYLARIDLIRSPALELEEHAVERLGLPEPESSQSRRRGTGA